MVAEIAGWAHSLDRWPQGGPRAWLHPAPPYSEAEIYPGWQLVARQELGYGWGKGGLVLFAFNNRPLYPYTAYTQSFAPGEKSSDFTPTSPPPRRVLSSHRSEVQPFRVPLCLRLERDPVLNSLRAAESSSTSCSTLFRDSRDAAQVPGRSSPLPSPSVSSNLR